MQVRRVAVEAMVEPALAGDVVVDADDVRRLALALPAGTDFASLALAPGTLAWTTSQATYLASTRTGAYMQVTRAYGYATGSRSVLLVSCWVL